jgi:hypothetical protein
MDGEEFAQLLKTAPALVVREEPKVADPMEAFRQDVDAISA